MKVMIEKIIRLKKGEGKNEEKKSEEKKGKKNKVVV